VSKGRPVDTQPIEESPTFLGFTIGQDDLRGCSEDDCEQYSGWKTCDSCDDVIRAPGATSIHPVDWLTADDIGILHENDVVVARRVVSIEDSQAIARISDDDHNRSW